MRKRFILKYVRVILYVFIFIIVINIFQPSSTYSKDLFDKYTALKTVNLTKEKIIQINNCMNYYNKTIKFENVYSDIKSNLKNNNEWEPLNQFIYTRYRAYYFSQQSIIRILALSKANFHNNYKISCLLEFDDEPESFICLNTKYSVLRNYNTYGAFAIDCILTQDIISNINKKAKLYLYNYEYEVRTRRAYHVNMSNELQKPVDSILLCSKQYNFTDSEYKNMKYWIDYSLNLGYNKIVLFNNSIPYQKFFKLFSSYGDKIEVRDYKYFPHLFLKTHLTSTPYFYHLKEISMELRRANERIAVNECFCENRLKYERIAVLDNDEVVIPRPIVSENNNLLYQQSPDIQINLTTYLNNLNRATDYQFDDNYWFTYARMMSNSFMKDFMYVLSNILNSKSNSTNYPIEFRVKSKYYIGRHLKTQYTKFIIRHEDDARYSENLLETYKNLTTNDVQQYLKKKTFTKFERIFCITLNYGFKEDGKSIHFTNSIVSIGHHESIDTKIAKVNPKMGYVSHFRNHFTYFSKTVIRVKSVFIDLYLYKYLSNTF